MLSQAHERLIAQQKCLIEIINKIAQVVNLEEICRFCAIEVKTLLKVERVVICDLEGTAWADTARSHNFVQSNQPVAEIWGQKDSSQNKMSLTITSQQKPWGKLLIEGGAEDILGQQGKPNFVQQIATHLSIAVDYSQMYQQQQQHQKTIEQAVDKAIDQQTTIANIIDKIRRSLNIETILTTTTEETRNLLKSDRVAIYRFNEDYSGEFIAESVAEGWRSLANKFPHSYQNSPDCTFNLLDNLELSDSYLQETQAEIFNPKDLFRVCNNIHEAEFSSCYRQLLERYQAKAYIIVAIYKNESLWGLLAAYENSGPRCWEPAEIHFMVQVGINLGIALQQGDLLAKTQEHEEQLQTALETALKQQADILLKINQKERSLAVVIDKIRQTLDLDIIFQTAATEVQKLLNVEHITIYRFDEHYGGSFIFESDPGDFVSLAGLTWNDDYLQQTQGGRFQNNQPCVINDIQGDERFSHCHQRMLERFGVRSLAIVPLFQETQLWGLLAAFEHTYPRQWQKDDIQLLERVAHHINIALQHSFYIEQIKAYGEEQTIIIQQERALSQVIEKIRQTLDLETIFKTAVREVRRLLNADRVAIFRFAPDSTFAIAELISEDVATGYRSALHETVEDHCFAHHRSPYYQPGYIFTINDLSKVTLLDCHRRILERFQVKANMVAPLLIKEELWGLLCIHQCSSPRQWKPSEKGFVSKIATQLSVGIQQAALLKESEQRAFMLERTLKQVEVQKEHLWEVAAQEKALARVIERIRQSLTLESIFASTTEEVRQILNSDRVVVYRFTDNWGGEFLYESVGKEWQPLITQSSPKPVWEDTYLQETQGGRYKKHEIFAVSDIDMAGLSPCHRENLKQFDVKAFITIPVFIGEKLWGILGVYDHQRSRYWHKREVDILKQVANQLGVAVYQSQLLTQTKQQSQDLQNTLADLNAIVDNLGDGLLVVDIYGRITRYNPCILSMFDIKTPLLGKQIFDILPNELSPLLARKNLDEQKVVTVEITLTDKRIGQALASNIITEQGNIGTKCIGVVILIRDVTKEREMEQIKSNFLSMVSHELRTPLTSIVGFSSLIRDKLSQVVLPKMKNPDPNTEKTLNNLVGNLDIVVSESERLGKLVSDFLDMTKIESGATTLDLLPIQLNLVLSWAIGSTAPLFQSSSIELIEVLPEDLPTILGDEDRLIQVFVNLISNSFKFTQEGTIICRAEVDHDNVLISITDTGVGIAEDDYSKVFEPFQQAGNILTDKPKGTGLGLSISKQIIEQHGGEIWFTSQLGKGTSFFVSLPLPKEN